MRGAAGLAFMDQRIRELIRRPAGRGRGADAVSDLVAGRRVDGSAFSEDELVSVIGC